MIRSALTLRTMDGRDRRLLWQALPLVIAVRAALWILPVRFLLGRASRRAEGACPTPTSFDPDRVAWSVRAAARRVPRATCLTQAVAAQILLARHGHRSRLYLGVARCPDGVMAAHAWVECGGRLMVGGRSVDRYARFPGLESASPRREGVRS
jgi:hypothetical protein